ncbi:26S proteasome non-ATPase regulatory subunit 6 [Dichanthelium oligosanthes]|uniref:26S proteasome regulatory subunit RPN7 n=1 Tax=Dichanthelium oligosanthes TaxID=888268 RepID=A0A1E5V111_9POAL|nr:26S proteasome non-ATPase regulatory subunit 6 [Dichanthelium oligosanthes]
MDSAGEDGKQQPHLVLAHKLFLLSHADVDDLAKVDLRADVLAVVKSDDMAALYESLASDGVLEMDAALLAEMRARIDEEIRKLDENLFEEGGDWERKNRLKVYEGLYCMATRNFKKATSLFLDSISTFTTYELFTYDTFIFYTVLTSVISLDRVSLKQKVVDAPEILAVIGKVPHLSEFLNSLYNCQYKSFFIAFSGLTEQIKLDRYLQPHFRYYMREVRTVVYSQFLESYKSVTMEAMATAFGVTVDFIDQELSRFIAAGKLHCKIDKFAAILETNRPDARNAFYQATIKQGDFLLNRIQKLSRVIDL